MAFLILIPQTLSTTAEIKISQYQTLIDNSSFNNHPKLETLLTYGSSSKLFYYYTYLYIGEEMQKQKLYNKYQEDITTSVLYAKIGVNIFYQIMMLIQKMKWYLALMKNAQWFVLLYVLIL